MNKLFAFLIAAIVLIGGAYFILQGYVAPQPATGSENARAVVENFGKQLQHVSLLAQRQQLERDMQNFYGPYAAPVLIGDWINNPLSAPGRLTSSPWPDRIEVRNIEQIGEGAVYRVEAEIVEVTNEGGGIGEAPAEALRRPVVIMVEGTADGLRITELTLGAYPGDGEWIYTEPNERGLQWLYPRALSTRYISTLEWPPLVELYASAYSCAEGPIKPADGPVKTVEKRMVGDREYCLTTWSEGAAGSSYTNYDYMSEQGDFVVRVVFTLRFPECANYGEDEQPMCEAEQETFDIDGLADRIAQSIRMN